jgi:hypothetical protein
LQSPEKCHRAEGVVTGNNIAEMAPPKETTSEQKKG